MKSTLTDDPHWESFVAHRTNSQPGLDKLFTGFMWLRNNFRFQGKGVRAHFRSLEISQQVEEMQASCGGGGMILKRHTGASETWPGK